MKVSVKTRRRNPRQYLLESALRYYSDKDDAFVTERASKLLARLLGADATMSGRGEPIFTVGVREALKLVYASLTPDERVEVRKAGRGATEKVASGGTEIPSPARVRSPDAGEQPIRVVVRPNGSSYHQAEEAGHNPA